MGRNCVESVEEMLKFVLSVNIYKPRSDKRYKRATNEIYLDQIFYSKASKVL